MSGSLSSPAQTPSIQFTQVPAATTGFQVPGDYFEVVPGYGRQGVMPFPARNLIIAQMTGAGTGSQWTLYQNIVDPTVLRTLAGPGSQADRIVTAYLKVPSTIPLDVILTGHSLSSTQAFWTRTFTTPVTAPGTYAVNICGTRVTFNCLAGDSAEAQAGDLQSAINGNELLPVGASVTSVGGSWIVSCGDKTFGAESNAYVFLENPLPGDVLPAGMTAGGWTQTVQGAGNPTFAQAQALMQGWWTDVLIPWSDSANLLAWEAEAERRYGAMVGKDVRGWYGFSGTLSQALASAAGVNGKFCVQAGADGWQTEPYVVAAVLMAQVSASLLADPSQQLKGIELPGVVGPVYANRWNDWTTQQPLLAGGVSTFTIDHVGTVYIQKVVMTYSTSPSGAPDMSWHEVMDPAVNTRIRYDWTEYDKAVWGRAKLDADGSAAAQANNGICTPQRKKASWATRYKLYADLGWVTTANTDLADTLFWIDPNNQNRLNAKIYFTRIGNNEINAGQFIYEVGAY
ncbi:MAG TPA: hypothetical protein PLO69_11060 [Gammaproteobacteria bacterium]|nr:hypothetical protein [Gammaproteobacteria bacterium]